MFFAEDLYYLNAWKVEIKKHVHMQIAVNQHEVSYPPGN